MLDTAFFLERVIPALNAGLAVSAQIIVPSALLGFLGAAESETETGTETETETE